MDPLSITASAIGIITFCSQTTKILAQLIDDNKNVDHTIKGFSDEVSHLSSVVQSISTSFQDPDIVSRISTTGHKGQHWRDVQKCLANAKTCLGRLTTILTTLKSSKKGIPGRVVKQVRVSLASGEIALLRRQISSFTQTMQISLQMISL